MESESQESELFHFATYSITDLLRSSEKKAQTETVGEAWENATPPPLVVLGTSTEILY